MKTLWITYSWEDNKDNQVDYIAQELEKRGIIVKLDKWTIGAGKRLWEQIDGFITKESECDAWAIIATENSLGSEPCKEEIAYALDRALNQRGSTFPLIGVFPASVEKNLIPSVIKTRLYVSLKDEAWIERVVAAVEARNPTIQKPTIDGYELSWRSLSTGKFSVEMRPRAGTWSPFVVFIPESEKGLMNPQLTYGAKGRVPTPTSLGGYMDGTMPDHERNTTWYFLKADNEATPTMSYILICDRLPSQVMFGKDGGPHYLSEKRV